MPTIYTGHGFFAVPAAPVHFLPQGPIPVLGFVLSVTPSIAMPLTTAKRLNLKLSAATEMDFTTQV